jgi:hypothetical protein
MSRRPGGRRQRNALPRGHKVTVRLSDGELAVIATAAGRAGLSAGAYIGRARADAGDGAAAGRLAGLLKERGDLDGLRARADAGDGAAARRLAGLLTQQGRGE